VISQFIHALVGFKPGSSVSIASAMTTARCRGVPNFYQDPQKFWQFQHRIHILTTLTNFFHPIFLQDRPFPGANF
jgi:hypothetical protein